MQDVIFGDLIDPENRLARHRERLDGVKHLHQRTPADPRPGQPISLQLRTGGALPFDAARCYYTTDDNDPATSPLVLELQPVKTTWDEISWGYVQEWTAAIPPQPAGTMVRYHLAARVTGTDRWVFADNQAGSADEATDFAVWVDDHPLPDWTRDALVYHIFLDRFYPGDGKGWLSPDSLSGFYGGTIRGVIQKLDYIQSLGFNTLWLSPLFPSSTHHGYNATDYYGVEPRLGTREELDELIAKAHQRGMRVLLDFVANHWSSQHPTFQAAVKDASSPYRDWYIWHHWPDEYEMFFTVKELPKINLKPGPAREYILECARYWLEQGIDGYRLDFAYGPPLDFWADFRRACRQAKTDSWIFGEVVHNADVQSTLHGLLDGTLDFLLAQALRETFAQGKWTLEEFVSFLDRHESYFPVDFSRPSFLDNHDMNRFYYLAGENKDRLKLAALVLYTLSGPPIVYNGTETAVSQSRPLHQSGRAYFEEARHPMLWGRDQDRNLVDYFRRMGELRNRFSALRRGVRKTVHLDPSTGTFAYIRSNDQDSVLVAINLSDQIQNLKLEGIILPESADERLHAIPFERTASTLSIAIPPTTGVLIA